jgi:hypothetical protein
MEETLAMANEEHLARLKQGVEAWNQWRAEHWEIRPDLVGADLRLVDLIESNLTRADLRGATLTGAVLTRMVLTRANLHEVSLIKADLRGAALRETDLTGADLTGATLTGADVTGATLTGATLTEANIGWTILGDVDLSTVRGLETVQHHGPSTIGIDTLYRSHGNIPEVFLRGAGLLDEMIAYIKSLNQST